MTSSQRPPGVTSARRVAQGRRTEIADIVRRQSQGTGPSARRAEADERRARIVAVIRQEGRLLLSELAKFLEVSEPTLLRDLTVLERANLVRRTSHGAVVAGSFPTHSALPDHTPCEGLQAVIARLCTGLIREKQTVFLDSSPAWPTIADDLSRLEVSVLTNALAVAEAMAERPAAQHMLLGGELCSTSRALVGPVTAAMLERFTVDIAFIGAGGLTDEGVSVAATAEGHVKKVAIRRARRVVVAAEASVIGRNDFFSVAGLRDIDDIVSDVSQPDLVRWCRTYGVHLHHPEHGA
ncbi:DeoR/GlpR family DNA-binding transcription regulator [Streptomyces rubrogriseus]|uniref:DeoR/GlpR family DNA-binding transcription regulator n=1 Tax=Streptomyces rubrogriseus TaxID=194673 RepID=UPI0036FE2FEA